MSASNLVDRRATRSRCQANGIELECDFPLAVPLSTSTGACRRIGAVAQPVERVRSLWSGGDGDPAHRTVLSEGVPLVVEAGSAGDHLISYGESPFHLAADLGTLTCAPPPEPDPGWQRALLDWVTYCAAVLTGIECVHASAVEIDGGALAFAAPSGAGKTTMAAELVSRGATFLGDDVLALELREGKALAQPGAPFANVDRRDSALAERLGTTEAVLGEELWISVERRAQGPVPVAAVVVLDRREDGPEPARIVAERFIALRGLAVGLPHLRGGEARRFSVLAALADQAPLLRLEAASAIPVTALADLVEAHLGAEGLP